MKALFHLNLIDASKQSELLGNIQNLIDDKKVEVEKIAAVINADAVDMVKEDSEAAEFIEDFPNKVSFFACSNSLQNRGIEEEELAESVEAVPSGVGKLNELQEDGYNYVKV